jgi:VTC domain
MAHSRDIRVHAFEVKFIVEPDAAARIRQWARTHLSPDPHGTGPFGDEYRTTSVYFDTTAYDVFHQRGSFGRGKYRIRRYGEDDAVFLERKMRQAIVLAKRRTHTPLATLERLRQALDPEWAGYWFHRRVVARALRPVCQVTYHRTARVLARSGDQIRLTLDSDLRARLLRDIRFARSTGIPVMDGRSILELKFKGFAPAIFRQLVEDLALNPQSASKYRLSVARLVPALSYTPLTSDLSTDALYA